MKCVVEIGSVAMIYVSSLIKTGLGILKLKGGGIHRQNGYRISLLRKVG
jgi:hypothetical protein